MLRVNLLPLRREVRLALRQLAIRPTAGELAFECVNVSEHMVKKLGAAAKLVDGVWAGPVTTDAWLSELGRWKDPAARAALSQQHTWLRVGNLFIDPTARQFHARLPCPLVVSVGHPWLNTAEEDGRG